MTDDARESPLPPPIVVRCAGGDLDGLLQREWLLANQLGAYASSTVVGCNTRRYHGLLVAATTPPVGRAVMLSNVHEQLIASGTTYELSTFEFADTFSPRGLVHLAEFRNDVAPTFVYRADGLELVKQVVLSEDTNALAVRYTLRGGSATLRLLPLVALRDFHHLRKVYQPHQMTFENAPEGVVVQDRNQAGAALHLTSARATFHADAQWWYRFCYRSDIARGQDGFEDLYTPGAFVCELEDGQTCQLGAGLDEPIAIDIPTTLQRRRERLAELAASVGPGADETTRRLAVATDAFVVNRRFGAAPASRTILAGYHWFADWGRDAMVALPGLLLATGRFDQARSVFRTFTERISEGMVPNHFDDYCDAAHYNSIDASLWYILAAERFLEATDDVDFWRATLLPAAETILTSYYDAARFDIRADGDGLLVGGSSKTQLTWMDAALGEEIVTPRHGKAVEVNALWYCVHRILAERCRGVHDDLAQRCAERAELIGAAFARTFWNDEGGYLHDCVTDGRPDASLRPNQIFAVSLPYSPLSAERQAAVVHVVAEKLLTPLGLRTLSPDDARYRRRCGGSWESRDRSYHQGTVWAWLIGPFIEAYLRVSGDRALAIGQARQYLEAFDEHLLEAGLGFVSEIFDGDRPHTPRGCIAQAWSVAEVLRARRLVEEHQAASG